MVASSTKIAAALTLLWVAIVLLVLRSQQAMLHDKRHLSHSLASRTDLHNIPNYVTPIGLKGGVDTSLEHRQVSAATPPIQTTSVPSKRRIGQDNSNWKRRPDQDGATSLRPETREAFSGDVGTNQVRNQVRSTSREDTREYGSMVPWGVPSGETLLTVPPGWQYGPAEPPIGPRKQLLVCLFTGGQPSKLTPTDQVDRIKAVESTWAGAGADVVRGAI